MVGGERAVATQTTPASRATNRVSCGVPAGFDFAKSFVNALQAAGIPSHFAMNCFRDEWKVTGTGGNGPESLPKQGSAVSLVNQNFGGKFPIGSN
jgi:hypothetical protein